MYYAGAGKKVSIGYATSTDLRHWTKNLGNPVIKDMSKSNDPFVYQEGGTYVIPGHGRICDQLDVVEYRDMIVVVRDVIQDMMKRGMTLEQIKEASPAKPFERQYGGSSGPWTTNNFIEAVYKSLAGKKQ